MENTQLSSELNKRQNEFADRLDRLKSSQQLLDAVKFSFHYFILNNSNFLGSGSDIYNFHG